MIFAIYMPGLPIDNTVFFQEFLSNKKSLSQNIRRWLNPIFRHKANRTSIVQSSLKQAEILRFPNDQNFFCVGSNKTDKEE